MSADARREQVLLAARAEFAATGLHGTSTDAIATRAGISQPYLFRLFGTKRDLFLACIDRGFDRVEEAFREAAGAGPAGEALRRMGEAYIALLGDRQELLAQMQAYAACDDAEIRTVVRRRFAGLWSLVDELTGAPGDDIRAFFATGMLLNVAAALDLPSIAETEDWARRCLQEATE